MKVEILTHNGGRYETEVPDYNAELINTEANNRDLNTLKIGEIIISRIELKMVVPINEQSQE